MHQATRNRQPIYTVYRSPNQNHLKFQLYSHPAKDSINGRASIVIDRKKQQALVSYTINAIIDIEDRSLSSRPTCSTEISRIVKVAQNNPDSDNQRLKKRRNMGVHSDLMDEFLSSPLSVHTLNADLTNLDALENIHCHEGPELY